MRNSWGSYWGEMGFARIMMHKVCVASFPIHCCLVPNPLLPHSQSIMSHSQTITLPHFPIHYVGLESFNVCILLQSNSSPTHPQDNLGLETDCDWGVPLLNPPSADAPPPTPSHKVPRGTYYDYKHPCVQKSKVNQPSARLTFHLFLDLVTFFLVASKRLIDHVFFSTPLSKSTTLAMKVQRPLSFINIKTVLELHFVISE